MDGAHLQKISEYVWKLTSTGVKPRACTLQIGFDLCIVMAMAMPGDSPAEVGMHGRYIGGDALMHGLSAAYSYVCG